MITDQSDADATYRNVDVRRADDGALEITRGGEPVAWYAAGQWIKADFVGLVGTGVIGG